MRIEYTTGCMSDGIIVDDKLISTTDEEKTLIPIILSSIRDLLSVLPPDGYECDREPCEQCGDYLETAIYNLDEV